ncbi:EamA family transporter RarD [Pyruvatibacter mobilis]|uniref:EamA family transporter RarD n=1 Tax=Pyruvatibacter mobilis TaxID=1712261 RepID=UPI003BADB7AA
MSGPDNRPASGGEATQTVSGGVLLAGSAFALWGVLPLFYKALGHVPVLDVLAHRGIWALVFLALIVTLTRRWAIVAGALTSPRVLGLLVVTGVLIGGNWGGFIYAVDAGRVLEASLGYFINPMMNVALGVVLLGEKLNGPQKAAIACAALGVLNQVILIGTVPWIALFLATSFAAYGYLRKTVSVESLDGLFVEMLVLAPLMISYLVWAEGPALGFAGADAWTIMLLLLTGPFTAIPLLLFAAGARRIHLATLGILQFIAPSIMFLMAVFLFGEPFMLANALTFGLIWTGLAVFAWDAWRNR